MKRNSFTTILIAGIAGIAGISALASENPFGEVLVYRSPDVALVIDRMPELAAPLVQPEEWKIVSIQDYVVYGIFGDHGPDHVGYGPMQLVYTYRPGLTGDCWGELTGTIVRASDSKRFKAITYET